MKSPFMLTFGDSMRLQCIQSKSAFNTSKKSVWTLTPASCIRKKYTSAFHQQTVVSMRVNKGILAIHYGVSKRSPLISPNLLSWLKGKLSMITGPIVTDRTGWHQSSQSAAVNSLPDYLANGMTTEDYLYFQCETSCWLVGLNWYNRSTWSHLLYFRHSFELNQQRLIVFTSHI